jgi:hypothetical protein
MHDRHDRMAAATAVALGLPPVSRDRRILASGVTAIWRATDDTSAHPERLVDVDPPAARTSAHARREKKPVRHGHLSTRRIRWARGPLAGVGRSAARPSGPIRPASIARSPSATRRPAISLRLPDT